MYYLAFRSWVLNREPDEGKLSRPDRKTGVDRNGPPSLLTILLKPTVVYLFLVV
jgi:hypothetical protein